MRIDSDCCNFGAFLIVLVNGNSADLNDCASFFEIFLLRRRRRLWMELELVL